MENKQRNITNNLIIVGIVLLALYFGKTLIIPFVIALVVWYLINSLKKLVAKIKINNKELPKVFQIIISVGVLVFILFFVGKLVTNNFEEFVKVYPKYHESILLMSEGIQQQYDIPISATSLVEKLNFQALLTSVLNSSFGFLGNVFLIIIYVIFLSIEQRIFGKKVRLMYNDKIRYTKFLHTMREIDQSIYTYISVKTGLCLLVSVSSYIVLLILNIDFAVLWAFLIFILNYIPIVGPIFGIGFPFIIAILQFPNSYVPALLVAIILFSIQAVSGNYIEPKVLGDKLNLSPLVVILALVFWGALWGVAGMVLCVPITVILMIIFRQFDSTRKVAILLSGGK